ncbi:conserved hypothetical protein [Cronobacter muytjensii 530]
MFHQRSNLIFYLGERFLGLRFVLGDTQHKSTIAIDGNDVGVITRRAILTQQITAKHRVGDRFKIDLLRNGVAAEPAGFNRFHACRFFSSRQRLVVVACRITYGTLQREEGIQRFLLLHFSADVVMHFRKRLHFGRLNVIKTHDKEADRRFDNARKLAFLFQTGVFKLFRRGARLQPAHITAVTGRDDIDRFLFGQRGEIRALLELREYRVRVSFSFGLDQAVAVALRLTKLILMFVVVSLNLFFTGVFGKRSGIKLDIADAELFRRHEVVGVLLVVIVDFLPGNLLLLCQRINRDGRGANLTLLREQRRELIVFARQNEVAAHNGVNQLVSGQLTTQRLRVLIGAHTHAGDNRVVARVIEFTVFLERRIFENRVAHLFVADLKLERMRILVDQRFVDQTLQYTLAQIGHIFVIGSELRKTIAQSSFEVVALRVDRVFKLGPADFLIVNFCGIVTVTANQVVTHASQNE